MAMHSVAVQLYRLLKEFRHKTADLHKVDAHILVYVLVGFSSMFHADDMSTGTVSQGL